MGILLKAEGITKIHKQGNGENFYALNQVDVEIPAGSLTILKGRSGSGKTTLLNILSALDDATEGNVWFEGENITQYSENKKEKLRRYEIGFVFQAVALIPMMTAYENVEYALRLAEYEGDREERAPSACPAFRWRTAESCHRPCHLP